MRYLLLASAAVALAGCATTEPPSQSALQALSAEANSARALSMEQVRGCMEREHNLFADLGHPMRLEDYDVIDTAYEPSASIKAAGKTFIDLSWSGKFDERVRVYSFNLKAKEGRVFGREQKLWCFGALEGGAFRPIVSLKSKTGRVGKSTYAQAVAALKLELGPPS